ncbi:hypothetical protein FGF66_01325 [Chlorobaculum thiosulfatiphilum]|uniref:Nucleoside 2-deoxyribosyltransferase n=1 Tax=Chlorobaculum thiosulfatiphilum TaxID=115852 RepID=A0A5C4SBV5_CHLTI|nr:hypothetical protein [Chlorobaculum thiosulfatiphilum]TNJ40419.1 hypothetical protein FGF66_01325 [Chlorobaculum thiosulfatiphilum]
MANSKSCFIIMPVTVPEIVKDRYRDGSEHFRHVLDCLLIPSVEKAGFNAIPPLARGSDLIHAEIIKQLETTDLVLCDMSALNPNVFFEFGIRTSLNKPVCVVKDDLTKHIPFDTGIINFHEYLSALEPWDLAKEITVLSEHIKASYERSDGKNTLWKYFGLRAEAAAYEGEPGSDNKLDLINLQLGSMLRRLDDFEKKSLFDYGKKIMLDSNKGDEGLSYLQLFAKNNDIDVKIIEVSISEDKAQVELVGLISDNQEKMLKAYIELFYGVSNVVFHEVPF